jgi:Flp pilus assembly protein TadG
VTPVLVLLLLGILDAGRAVVAATSIGNAAREGARYVAVHLNEGTCSSSNCQVEAQAAAVGAALGLDSGQMTVTVTVSQGIASVGITYPFHPVAPIVSSVFGTPTLSTTSSMRVR